MSDQTRESNSRYFCHICHGPLSINLRDCVVTDERGKAVHQACHLKQVTGTPGEEANDSRLGPD
jgi:hypothetical protein